MRFEFIIALRYLRAKRKQAVVSVITGVSVIGVAAGVAALIIALAMNTGFRQDLESKLLGAQPHITLLSPTGQAIDNYMDIVARVNAIDGVVAATPAINQEVLISNGYRSDAAYFKGIIPELESQRSSPLNSLVEGDLDDFGEFTIYMGVTLSNSMGSFIGDKITAQSIVTNVTPLGGIPRSLTFDVQGLFRSGLYEFDARYVYAPMWAVQRLGGLTDVVSAIEIQIENADDSDVLGPIIVASIDSGLDFTDWKTQNTPLFQALQLERLAMWLAIGLIVLVASLNIVGTLVMMVMEKARDVAVLMSMGATRDNIRRVFIAQGVIIGVVGTFIGLVVGNGVAIVADTYKLISLSEEIWSIDHVPFDPTWTDSAIVAVAAILVSYLATLYPSRAASALEPVEGLRYE
jgi:lipoprotein-releasing system permease protein